MGDGGGQSSKGNGAGQSAPGTDGGGQCFCRVSEQEKRNLCGQYVEAAFREAFPENPCSHMMFINCADLTLPRFYGPRHIGVALSAMSAALSANPGWLPKTVQSVRSAVRDSGKNELT